MKRVSLYIAAIVIVGVVVIFSWAYQRYFKTTNASYLSFVVSRGDIQETVKVRGVVVPQTEFNLAFPQGGNVSTVYVSEGQTVAADAPLMRLDAVDLQNQRGEQVAVLAQERASLAKLLSGATAEDINVVQLQVTSAERSLRDANAVLLNALNIALTQSDDAVRNKADEMFTNPRSASPVFVPFVTDSQLASSIASERASVEAALQSWRTMLAEVTQDGASGASQDTVNRVMQVQRFLNDVAFGINTALPTASVTQTVLDTWKTDIATARANVNTALTAVIAAQEKVAAADSALAVAQSELTLKTSTPRSEDIAIAQAKVDQSVSRIASIDDQLFKSTLRAPSAGVVKKLWLKKFETATAGVTAVTFSTAGQKMQADITELSIGSVHTGGSRNAAIVFDAFPEQTFLGTVVSIDSQEVIKDSDVYYRADISIDRPSEQIRSGMNADIVISGNKRSGVLTVPEIVVFKRGGASFVQVVEPGISPSAITPSVLHDREVTTGISNSESIEILSGLSEGETVVAPSQ